jgi:hypothetical protein
MSAVVLGKDFLFADNIARKKDKTSDTISKMQKLFIHPKKYMAYAYCGMLLDDKRRLDIEYKILHAIWTLEQHAFNEQTLEVYKGDVFGLGGCRSISVLTKIGIYDIDVHGLHIASPYTCHGTHGLAASVAIYHMRRKNHLSPTPIKKMSRERRKKAWSDYLMRAVYQMLPNDHWKFDNVRREELRPMPKKLEVV